MRCESQSSNTMFSPVLHPYLPWKNLTHLLSHLLKTHQWLLNALTTKATGYKVPVRLGPCSDLSLLFSPHCSRRKPLGFLSASQIESSFPVRRHCTCCSSSHTAFPLTLHLALTCPSGLILTWPHYKNLP